MGVEGCGATMGGASVSHVEGVSRVCVCVCGGKRGEPVEVGFVWRLRGPGPSESAPTDLACARHVFHPNTKF